MQLYKTYNINHKKKKLTAISLHFYMLYGAKGVIWETYNLCLSFGVMHTWHNLYSTWAHSSAGMH